jgi:hypothetical protein
MAQAAAGPDSSESFTALQLESFARLLIEQIDRCTRDR